MEVGNLLDEWMGPPVSLDAEEGGAHQPACIEAAVGPLHHYRWRGGSVSVLNTFAAKNR